MSSTEEAESWNSEVDSRITGVEVNGVVKKLHGGRAPGLDEIQCCRAVLG